MVLPGDVELLYERDEGCQCLTCSVADDKAVHKDCEILDHVPFVLRGDFQDLYQPLKVDICPGEQEKVVCLLGFLDVCGGRLCLQAPKSVRLPSQPPCATRQRTSCYCKSTF